MTRPHHLQIFLSNRCNLSCSYCYVAVNKGPSLRLEFDQLAAAVDRLLEAPSSAPKRVSFLGGEPFLQLPVVLKTVDYLRKASSAPVAVNVYTNGTRLTAKSLQELSSRGVFTMLSLDGKKGANDRNRTFARGRRSVFDAVMRRVRPLPKDRMGVSMVLDSANAEDLTANVDFFYRQGFRSINFYPDIYENFTPAALTALRRGMADFSEYYLDLFKKGRPPFTIPAFDSILRRHAETEGGPWWRSCDKFVLGANGQFHACDKAMSFTPERMAQSAVGSAKSGMDWERRDDFFQQARRVVEREAPEQKFSFCPMGSYFYSRWAGKDPRDLMGSFRKVDQIYTTVFLALNRKLRSCRAFQEAYHLPAGGDN